MQGSFLWYCDVSGIGATILTRQENQCLPYVVFFNFSAIANFYQPLLSIEYHTEQIDTGKKVTTLTKLVIKFICHLRPKVVGVAKLLSSNWLTLKLLRDRSKFKIKFSFPFLSKLSNFSGCFQLQFTRTCSKKIYINLNN